MYAVVAVQQNKEAFNFLNIRNILLYKSNLFNQEQSKQCFFALIWFPCNYSLLIDNFFDSNVSENTQIPNFSSHNSLVHVTMQGQETVDKNIPLWYGHCRGHGFAERKVVDAFFLYQYKKNFVNVNLLVEIVKVSGVVDEVLDLFRLVFLVIFC